VPAGYISGTVTLVGGIGIMTSVVVSAGASNTYPDQFGNYMLQVPPGTYNVIASLAAYIPDTVFNVTVANQQTINGVNLTLTLAPTNGLMTGTVTLNGGTGNVTQVVVSAGGGVATTNPNASGFYTLDLVAGNYDVTASLSGYGTQMLIGVPVVVNQTTPNVNFTLVPVASSGYIQGHVAITGEPADVTLTNVTAGSYATHPDAAGNYSLTVPAGNYSVTATHAYTTTQTINNVMVTSAMTTPGIDFILTVNRADMIVKAKDQDGFVMNNVEVVIEGPEGPYTGTIINDSLVFPHVPYGTFNGSATYGMFIAVSNAVIGAGNHLLQFNFVITGMIEKTNTPTLRVNPNPAGPNSRVQFTIPASGRWTLDLIDAHGGRINGLTLHRAIGNYHLSVKDIAGNIELPAGVYCLRLSGEEGLSAICRMMIIAP
jgi:hypothetical protein